MGAKDGLIGFFYASFGGFGSLLLKIFPGLEAKLDAAAIRIYPEAYAATVSGLTIIAGLICTPASILLYLFTRNIFALTLLAGPILVLIIGMLYPYSKASSIASVFDSEVPYAATYLAVMATGGVPPYTSLRRIAKSELMPNLAKIARIANIKVDATGEDPVSAIEDMAKNVSSKEYRDLLDDRVFSIHRKKLLIVTYRFTIPPLGGAEVYLYELIKVLDDTGDFDITVAYLDAYDIENQYHFSINATHNSKHLQNKLKNTRFRKFEYDEIEDEVKLANSRILMKKWIDEYLISARKFISFFDSSILMGGWNFPEQTNQSTQIWSSTLSEIYLKNVKKLRLKGFSPSRKSLTFQMNNSIIDKKIVDGIFEINVAIPSDGVVTLECKKEKIDEELSKPLTEE